MSQDPVHRALDQLFRREAGQLVATLTRIFGPSRLDLAESVVQEALLSAVQTWPAQGIPENPAGWTMRVARNKATDILRKEKLVGAKEPELGRFLAEGEPDAAAATHPVDGALRLAKELQDDQLRLLFICCHPVLGRDAMAPLALKTLFGFDVRQIAAAFLTQDATIAQRLVRAKKKIADAGLKYELPPLPELPERLDFVLETLYLLFSEGYNTHGGDALVRKDICLEALRIGTALADHDCGNTPRTHALLALMCFNASRLDARTDDAGDILLLESQDRTLWDHRLIAQGIAHLDGASQGDALTPYHLQAGIAACHALAPSFAATDWSAIVDYYDDLLRLGPSPVIALNRAAALAMRDGPAKGLAALKTLKGDKALADYYLLEGVEAELLMKLGRKAEAAACYRAALAKSTNAPERRFLERRLTLAGAE